MLTLLACFGCLVIGATLGWLARMWWHRYMFKRWESKMLKQMEEKS